MLLSKVAKITGAKDTHEKEKERCEATGREAVEDRVGRERDREGDRVRLLLS